MKTKSLFYIFIVIAIMLISGCINHDNNKDSEIDGIGTYIVEVNAEMTDGYTLIVPFPANEGGYMSEVYNDLKIKEGHCDYNITNTSKGLDEFGLKIKFNSSFKLMWKEKYEPLTYLSLEDRKSSSNSSWYEENPKWMFYLEKPLNNTIQIYLRYEVDKGSIMEGYLINQEIGSQGWTRVSGKKIIRQD